MPTWRRAVLLDQWNSDVFRWFYKKIRPAFSTFFLNSTAHFQHYHWREMEPELFKVQPSPEKLAAHNHTILFGYQEMDVLIGRFLELAEPEYRAGVRDGNQPATVPGVRGKRWEAILPAA